MYDILKVKCQKKMVDYVISCSYWQNVYTNYLRKQLLLQTTLLFYVLPSSSLSFLETMTIEEEEMGSISYNSSLLIENLRGSLELGLE